MGAQEQYNTSIAFKSIQVRKTSHLLSGLFLDAVKLLALPALLIGPMVFILPSKVCRLGIPAQQQLCDIINP